MKVKKNLITDLYIKKNLKPLIYKKINQIKLSNELTLLNYDASLTFQWYCKGSRKCFY